MSETSNRSDPAASAGSDSLLPTDPAERDRIERSVAGYVETLASLDPATRTYTRSIASIDRLGQREFSTVAALSGRMLDRRLRDGRSALEARGPIARQLAELRRLVDELDPARAGLAEPGSKRSRGPFGLGPEPDLLEALESYLDRFGHARDRLEQTLLTLESSRLALERDNALLGQERVSLATVMESLREHAYLAARLDEALDARIGTIAASDPARAECLRADILHAVRRRRQEILTQLAVATQGAASLRIVEEGNDQMIRAIAAATTITTSALRTAAMVAQAVAGQRAAMEQVRAAEAMAGEVEALLEREAEGPDRTRGAQARVAMLRRAWGDVQMALDRLDAQKEQVIRDLARAEAAPKD